MSEAEGTGQELLLHPARRTKRSRWKGMEEARSDLTDDTEQGVPSLHLNTQSPPLRNSLTYHAWKPGVANERWEVVGIIGLLVGLRVSVGVVLVPEQEAGGVVTIKGAVEVEVGDVAPRASDGH